MIWNDIIWILLYLLNYFIQFIEIVDNSDNVDGSTKHFIKICLHYLF